jgi:hypothetical protein
MERAIRYDAVIATLVGISALLVSAYTAHIQRQQVRAQVYPIVLLQSGYSDDDVHVTLINKGSGPALLRNVSFSVDGQAIHNWLELVTRAIGEEREPRNLGYSSFGRSVVAAGEQIHVLTLSCKPPSERKAATTDRSTPMQLAALGPSDPTCARLLTLLRRASISVCYCSTLDECAVLSDGPDRDPTTTETRRCPTPSADSFN